jgi:hypothetical protein
MYKVTYLPDPSISQIVNFQEFDTYRSAMYFANKFYADGIILEIKYYPKENNKPDRN